VVNMGKITAIKVQKRDPQRVNIYLDGEFAFPAARIVAAWLYVGQDLDEAAIEQLKAQDVDEKAYQQSLRLLNYRPRSETEMRRKLIEKNYSEDVVSKTVERLKSSGLLNDTQFARDWVENRTVSHPRSRRVMRIELRQKGLADEAIQAALTEQVQEDELAYRAAQRYCRRLAGLAWNEFRAKLGGYLGRRGFSYATISPVVARCWSELREEENSNR
jgi:regulatory protein